MNLLYKRRINQRTIHTDLLMRIFFDRKLKQPGMDDSQNIQKLYRMNNFVIKGIRVYVKF